MKNILLVLTFFSLWLSTRLNVQLQDYLAYGFILTFGVLHGSNDINILTKLPAISKKSTSLILRYLLAVLGVVFVFFISKPATLIFFLLISGYHFGEQHLGSGYSGKFWFGALLFGVYGLTILFLIFYLKVDEVVPIFWDITGVAFNNSFFSIGLYSITALLFLLVALGLWRKNLKINVLKELFLLLVFVVVFSTASLVWAFCIYFIVWHSIPSLYDQMIFLYGNASKLSVKKYLRSSWFYWFVSIAALALLYFFIGENTERFITVVLYVLAAITFPHVLVMSRVEQTKNEGESSSWG